jgi:choice-of-anchor C domain-containing protein
VARAFTALPERWRTVLWHTEVEGESPAQVAPLLGLSANGVAALAYRAREGLRTAYIQAHLSTAEVEKQCRACASKLASYLRDSVSPRARRRIEEHLDGCDRCRLLLAELSEVSSSLRGVLAPIVLGPSASAYSAPEASSPSGTSPSATRPPSLAQADGEPVPVRASGFPTVGGAAVVTSVVAGFTALGFGAFFSLHPVSSAPPKQASGPPSPIGPTQPSDGPRPGPVGPWRQPSPRSRPNPPTASSTPEIAKVPTVGPSWSPPTPSPDVTASRPSGTPTAYPNPVLSDDNFATPPAGPTFLTYRAGQSIGGWKVTQNSVNLKSAHYWQTPKGSQSIDLNGDPPAPIAGAIAQTFGTVADRRYTVTFDLAGNVEGAPAVKTLVVQVGGVTQGFSFDTTGHSHSNMGWKVETVRFTATGAQTTLRFTSTTDPNSMCGPVITNVHVKAR